MPPHWHQELPLPFSSSLYLPSAPCIFLSCELYKVSPGPYQDAVRSSTVLSFSWFADLSMCGAWNYIQEPAPFPQGSESVAACWTCGAMVTLAWMMESLMAWMLALRVASTMAKTLSASTQSTSLFCYGFLTRQGAKSAT